MRTAEEIKNDVYNLSVMGDGPPSSVYIEVLLDIRNLLFQILIVLGLSVCFVSIWLALIFASLR